MHWGGPEKSSQDILISIRDGIVPLIKEGTLSEDHLKAWAQGVQTQTGPGVPNILKAALGDAGHIALEDNPSKKHISAVFWRMANHSLIVTSTPPDGLSYTGREDGFENE